MYLVCLLFNSEVDEFVDGFTDWLDAELISQSQLLVDPCQLLVGPCQLMISPCQLMVSPSQLLVD